MKKPEINGGRIFSVLVLLITFSVNFDSAAVIPIIANYAIHLGASLIMAGMIVGIYSIVHLPSNILLGRIVDKIGRRIPLIIGLCLDALSLLLYAIALNPIFLLSARLIHGIGGGFGGPATMSYFGDMTPKERSGRVMALYGIAVAFSMLMGFIVGGFAIHLLGYTVLFMGIATILFIMAGLSLLLPTTYRPPSEKIPLKKEISILKQTVLRKVMISPYLSIFVANFNLGMITTGYTIILKDAGYTDAYIGMFLAVMVLLSIVIHYPAGLLGDRIGKREMTGLGLLFVAVSFVVLLFSTELPYPIVGMTILGIGHGLIFPTAAGIIRENTSSENRGIATGTFYGLIVAGVAVGAPITGLILELTGINLSIIAGIVVPLIAMAIILQIKPD